MMILEMVPYDPNKHEPRTGWDAFSINMALEMVKVFWWIRTAKSGPLADGIMSVRSERE